MNKSFLSVAAISLLLNGGVRSIPAAAAADAAGTAASPSRHWTADNGNGTYSNPLFYEEFEDPDPIRVGDDYYLAGTTMHMNPAVQLMHSKDLVNWELAGYCADKLDLGPAYRLEGGNIYGRGIWAPCIRYHDGDVLCLLQRQRRGSPGLPLQVHQRSLGAQPVARKARHVGPFR